MHGYLEYELYQSPDKPDIVHVTVYDKRVAPFTINLSVVPHHIAEVQTYVNTLAQNMIAAKLTAHARDPARLPAGRHDRGWPH
jgi:hypothetical protein